jgi:hypothetical protein
MAAAWALPDGDFERHNLVDKAPQVAQKPTLRSPNKIVYEIWEALDCAIAIFKRRHDNATKRYDFAKSNILKLVPDLVATTPNSLGEYPSLEQVFQLLMGFIWKEFYPSSVAQASVEASQLTTSKAMYWLLQSMEAIWIIHCYRNLDDALRKFLKWIVL